MDMLMMFNVVYEGDQTFNMEVRNIWGGVLMLLQVHMFDVSIGIILLQLKQSLIHCCNTHFWSNVFIDWTHCLSSVLASIGAPASPPNFVSSAGATSDGDTDSKQDANGKECQRTHYTNHQEQRARETGSLFHFCRHHLYKYKKVVKCGDLIDTRQEEIIGITLVE